MRYAVYAKLRPLPVLMGLLPALLGLVGCGALDVSDPTQVEDADIGNSIGADLMRRQAVASFAFAIGRGALASGLLTDEFFTDAAPSSGSTDEGALDRRQSLIYEELANASTISLVPYAGWHGVRRAVAVALPRLRAHMPEPARSAYVGQMLALRGFATLRLAEDVCPGFPINEMVDYRLVYGPPRTTAQALEQALADFDSAVVAAADSARFLHLAQVGRGRTLLGLGRFADAAAAVAAVPTSYVANAEFRSSGVSSEPNGLVFYAHQQRSVSDREGGAGPDYVSANDPRVQTTLLGLADDGVTELRAIGKYPNGDAPIVVASGIEARLIEAEAALRAGQPQWLAVLNELRRTQVSPALPDTTDPGTEAARVDLLFRERAFWLFATGHRLGDLRRLLAHYGRTPDQVFPSGAYRGGGTYDTGTSIPFPWKLEAAFNPAVTGCTSR